MEVDQFKKLIRDYYHAHGRDLPWRRMQDPYAIFVSEIMLQQTQVSRVLQQFPLFMTQFPDFATLAAAQQSDVLARWQGMGYNRRALWLKRAAEIVVHDHGGQLPTDPAALAQLPGIGPNTAGSIAAFVFNAPSVFIETNIRRVFIHHFFTPSVIAWKSERPRQSRSLKPDCHATLAMTDKVVDDREILSLVEATLDRTNPREWYFALMDYGAQLPKQVANPNRRSRHYTKQSQFEGSNRQKRAAILRALISSELSLADLSKQLDQPARVLEPIVADLTSEGFILAKNGRYSLVQ